jgi:hypothetical protein
VDYALDPVYQYTFQTIRNARIEMSDTCDKLLVMKKFANSSFKNSSFAAPHGHQLMAMTKAAIHFLHSMTHRN